MSAPYIPLYINDYLIDTRDLSCVENGAYLLLLLEMWRAGGKLPANDVKLAVLAKCSMEEWLSIKVTVLAFFKRRGSVIRHKRITTELEKYQTRVAHCRSAGKKGGSGKRSKVEPNTTPIETRLKQSDSRKFNENNLKTEAFAKRSLSQQEPKVLSKERTVGDEFKLRLSPEVEAINRAMPGQVAQ